MQVREHTESTLRQYALADTAVAMGWAPRDVEVIDRDLGLSGTSAAHRQGFRELMSRVCLGEIGAVFGLEISRLGRSNADLARLAEMARLTGTLLIDSDGVLRPGGFQRLAGPGVISPPSASQRHQRRPMPLILLDDSLSAPGRQRRQRGARGLRHRPWQATRVTTPAPRRPQRRHVRRVINDVTWASAPQKLARSDL